MSADDNVYDHTPCPHGCTERGSHWHRHDAAHEIIGELHHWHVYNPRRVTVAGIRDAVDRHDGLES